MPRSSPAIDSADVPQAPNLARIRAVVTAVASGAATLDAIGEEIDVSTRHVAQSVRAAQALDLLDRDRALTPRGRTLLETDQEGPEERAAFRASIEESAIVRALAPGLLSAKPPTRKAVTARIERLSGLSKATAEQRASDILAWREQILEESYHDGGDSHSTAQG
jgi:hypothetical protein